MAFEDLNDADMALVPPPDSPEGIQRAEEAYESLERAAIQDDGVDDIMEGWRKRRSQERAKRRARAAVRDLGLCNDFTYFVTLTLDGARIDRYDPREVVRRLNRWLDNAVRRSGLKYVLVPEHHKDGAIHFHGFFNDALEAVDSGHKDRGGHTVYNLPRWTWGFSTAIRLYGERAAAVAYTCKYINKAQEKIGGRWYYSGGDLRKPDVSWLDVDFDRFVGLDSVKSFEVEGLAWARFAHLRVGAGTDLPAEVAEGAGASREDIGERSGSDVRRPDRSSEGGGAVPWA